MDIRHRGGYFLVFSVILALAAIIAIVLQTNYSLDVRPKYTMAQASFLANLQLNITPSSDSYRSILVSLSNNHSSIPVTILKWNSPLDPAALRLGLVHVIPAGASQPVHIDTIKISRLMPPEANSLVTLFPGETVTNTLELRDPIVPSVVWNAGPVKIKMAGRWMAVWPGLTKEDLLSDAQRLQSVGAGVGSLTGDWESEYVDISG